jgi:hypothetical protein
VSSFCGAEGGWPNISAEEAWKKRIFGSSCRMPSSNCKGAAPAACSVSKGSSKEALAELCAARLYTSSG